MLFFLSCVASAHSLEYKGNCKSTDDYNELPKCLEKELQYYDRKLNILYQEQLKKK